MQSNGFVRLSPDELRRAALGATVEMRREANRMELANPGDYDSYAKSRAQFKSAERIARKYRMSN